MSDLRLSFHATLTSFFQGNLVYLAMISQRVPIIGPFTPSHIGGEAGSIPFSEVFDLDRLSTAIGMSVVEWGEVKDPASTEIENLGCWSIWQAVQTNEAGPRITGALSQGLGIPSNSCWSLVNGADSRYA